MCVSSVCHGYTVHVHFHFHYAICTEYKLKLWNTLLYINIMKPRRLIVMVGPIVLTKVPHTHTHTHTHTLTPHTGVWVYSAFELWL